MRNKVDLEDRGRKRRRTDVVGVESNRSDRPESGLKGCHKVTACQIPNDALSIKTAADQETKLVVDLREML